MTSSAGIAKDDGKDYPVLDQGEKAPFRGILFTETQARNANSMAIDLQLKVTRCENQTALCRDTCNAEKDSLQSSCDADKRLLNTNLRIASVELQSCKDQWTWMRKNERYLLSGVGVLSTVATGLVCFFGAPDACLYTLGGGVALMGGTLLVTIIF